jgi:23S rRNA (uracil1939-C5)-methyltransferase
MMDEQREEPNDLSVGAMISVRVMSMANGGAAVGRVGDLVVFVDGAMIGETVRARITERRRSFARATTVEIDEPSPDRVTPPCPYFGPCGGCQWQYMAYGAQLAAKHEIVRDQFRRGLRLSDDALHTIVREPLGMVDPWRYRNVVTVEPNRDGKPSFHHLHSAQLVPIDHCPISQPVISDTLRELSARGITAETTIRAREDGIGVAFTERLRETVRESLLGVPFRVSGGAFFQVNTRPEMRAGVSTPQSMADILATEVLNGLALTGAETVLDLYAGVGTFAILAAPNARRVIAVEEAPIAATDARYNAEAARARNVEVHTRKAEHLMTTLGERVDAAVLDPPRSGCAPPVLDGLMRLRPRRIVYVSCDVATLVRDLRALGSAYALESCQIVDMFPQTFHIETVNVLTRVEKQP